MPCLLVTLLTRVPWWISIDSPTNLLVPFNYGPRYEDCEGSLSFPFVYTSHLCMDQQLAMHFGMDYNKHMDTDLTDRLDLLGR